MPPQYKTLKVYCKLQQIIFTITKSLFTHLAFNREAFSPQLLVIAQQFLQPQLLLLLGQIRALCGLCSFVGCCGLDTQVQQSNDKNTTMSSSHLSLDQRAYVIDYVTSRQQYWLKFDRLDIPLLFCSNKCRQDGYHFHHQYLTTHTTTLQCMNPIVLYIIKFIVQSIQKTSSPPPSTTTTTTTTTLKTIITKKSTTITKPIISSYQMKSLYNIIPYYINAKSHIRSIQTLLNPKSSNSFQTPLPYPKLTTLAPNILEYNSTIAFITPPTDFRTTFANFELYTLEYNKLFLPFLNQLQTWTIDYIIKPHFDTIRTLLDHNEAVFKIQKDNFNRLAAIHSPSPIIKHANSKTKSVTFLPEHLAKSIDPTIKNRYDEFRSTVLNSLPNFALPNSNSSSLTLKKNILLYHPQIKPLSNLDPSNTVTIKHNQNKSPLSATSSLLLKPNHTLVCPNHGKGNQTDLLRTHNPILPLQLISFFDFLTATNTIKVDLTPLLKYQPQFQQFLTEFEQTKHTTNEFAKLHIKSMYNSKNNNINKKRLGKGTGYTKPKLTRVWHHTIGSKKSTPLLTPTIQTIQSKTRQVAKNNSHLNQKYRPLETPNGSKMTTSSSYYPLHQYHQVKTFFKQYKYTKKQSLQLLRAIQWYFPNHSIPNLLSICKPSHISFTTDGFPEHGTQYIPPTDRITYKLITTNDFERQQHLQHHHYHQQQPQQQQRLSEVLAVAANRLEYNQARLPIHDHYGNNTFIYKDHDDDFDDNNGDYEDEQKMLRYNALCNKSMTNVINALSTSQRSICHSVSEYSYHNPLTEMFIDKRRDDFFIGSPFSFRALLILFRSAKCDILCTQGPPNVPRVVFKNQHKIQSRLPLSPFHLQPLHCDHAINKKKNIIPLLESLPIVPFGVNEIVTFLDNHPQTIPLLFLHPRIFSLLSNHPIQKSLFPQPIKRIKRVSFAPHQYTSYFSAQSVNSATKVQHSQSRTTSKIAPQNPQHCLTDWSSLGLSEFENKTTHVVTNCQTILLQSPLSLLQPNTQSIIESTNDNGPIQQMYDPDTDPSHPLYLPPTTISYYSNISSLQPDLRTTRFGRTIFPTKLYHILRLISFPFEMISPTDFTPFHSKIPLHTLPTFRLFAPFIYRMYQDGIKLPSQVTILEQLYKQYKFNGDTYAELFESFHQLRQTMLVSMSTGYGPRQALQGLHIHSQSASPIKTLIPIELRAQPALSFEHAKFTPNGVVIIPPIIPHSKLGRSFIQPRIVSTSTKQYNGDNGVIITERTVTHDTTTNIHVVSTQSNNSITYKAFTPTKQNNPDNDISMNHINTAPSNDGDLVDAVQKQPQQKRILRPVLSGHGQFPAHINASASQNITVGTPFREAAAEAMGLRPIQINTSLTPTQNTREPIVRYVPPRRETLPAPELSSLSGLDDIDADTPTSPPSQRPVHSDARLSRIAPVETKTDFSAWKLPTPVEGVRRRNKAVIDAQDLFVQPSNLLQLEGHSAILDTQLDALHSTTLESQRKVRFKMIGDEPPEPAIVTEFLHTQLHTPHITEDGGIITPAYKQALDKSKRIPEFGELTAKVRTLQRLKQDQEQQEKE